MPINWQNGMSNEIEKRDGKQSGKSETENQSL